MERNQRTVPATSLTMNPKRNSELDVILNQVQNDNVPSSQWTQNNLPGSTTNPPTSPAK